MSKAWQRKKWQDKRKEILEKHDGTCQVCGEKKNPLVIHHTDSKGDIDYEALTSYIIICKGCHWHIHNGYDLCKCGKWKKWQYHTCWDCIPKEIKKRIKVSTVEVITPCGRKGLLSQIENEVMGYFEICHECDKLQGCKFMKE